MAALRVRKAIVTPHSPAAADVDPAWRKLYLIAAYATALFIVLSLCTFVTPLTGLPSGASQTRLSLPAATETLRWISTHRTVYIADELLLLTPAYLTIVTFMALFAALKHVERAWSAIGAALGISSLTASLAAVTVALGLVSISDQFSSAATALQRTALEGAATSLIVMYNVPTLSAVLWPAGILAVSIAMLKGVFPRWVAYVGIAAGVAGIIGEAAFPIVPPVFYVYGLLMLVWMIAVTGRLFALGRVSGG